MAACNKKREGKDFRMTEKTKVMCSRHFRSSDLKKSLNGRVYVKDNVVPSRFLILKGQYIVRNHHMVSGITTKEESSSSTISFTSYHKKKDDEAIDQRCDM